MWQLSLSLHRIFRQKSANFEDEKDLANWWRDAGGFSKIENCNSKHALFMRRTGGEYCLEVALYEVQQLRISLPMANGSRLIAA